MPAQAIGLLTLLSLSIPFSSAIPTLIKRDGDGLTCTKTGPDKNDIPYDDLAKALYKDCMGNNENNMKTVVTQTSGSWTGKWDGCGEDGAVCSDIFGPKDKPGDGGDFKNLVNNCKGGLNGNFYGGTIEHVLNWGEKKKCGKLTLSTTSSSATGGADDKCLGPQPSKPYVYAAADFPIKVSGSISIKDPYHGVAIDDPDVVGSKLKVRDNIPKAAEWKLRPPDYRDVAIRAQGGFGFFLATQHPEGRPPPAETAIVWTEVADDWEADHIIEANLISSWFNSAINIYHRDYSDILRRVRPGGCSHDNFKGIINGPMNMMPINKAVNGIKGTLMQGQNKDWKKADARVQVGLLLYLTHPGIKGVRDRALDILGRAIDQNYAGIGHPGDEFKAYVTALWDPAVAQLEDQYDFIRSYPGDDNFARIGSGELAGAVHR